MMTFGRVFIVSSWLKTIGLKGELGLKGLLWYLKIVSWLGIFFLKFVFYPIDLYPDAMLTSMMER